MRHAGAITGTLALVALALALAGCQAESRPKYFLKPKDPDASTVPPATQPGAPGMPGAPSALPPR